jgi:prepilin-type N-terminal cleavage/methylation domain-containing protein
MKTRNQTAGFSLLEVMCAILILGVGLVGLTHGIAAALQASKESELQTTAALLAAGQIETLRADGFIINGETDGDGDGDISLYHWRQSVTPTRIEGLHEVEVMVENSNTGKTIYELKTLLFDPPVSSILDEPDGKKDSGKKKGGPGR